MKNGLWQNRVICLALAILLLLVFATLGHDCHHEQCPICYLTASFRFTMALLALALPLPLLSCKAFATGEMQDDMAGKELTLVALKVKLSD